MGSEKFKYVLRVDKEIGEVVEHIVSIPDDCKFSRATFNYHVVTCKERDTGIETKRLMEVAVKLTKDRDYDAETPAVWVYSYGIWGACEEGIIESDSEPHPDFKHAWIRFAVSQYWTVEEVIVEVEGEVSWTISEQPPGEQPPEQPPEPEKPTEPFDVGKWIEWALRNILRDEEPPSCSPHNTWLLVSLLAAIYTATLADIDFWCSVLGLIPIPSVFLGEFWRVFTHMWLHYPVVEVFNGWTIPHAHIAFNVLFLYVFGDNVECRLGYGKYIAYYIVCGIIAGLGEVAWLHIVGLGYEPIVIIGASGAISGILGLYLILFPDNRVVFMGKDMRAWYFLALWFLGQVAMLFQFDVGVAVAAHIIGFITGAVLGYFEKRVEEYAETLQTV